MKRLHVHVGVADLDRSIHFYSALFGAGPSVVKPDYAKWMLDDPRVNFAISQGKHDAKGVEHLGIQAEDADELAQVYGRLKAAGLCSRRRHTCFYATRKKPDPDPDVSRGGFLTRRSPAMEASFFPPSPKCANDACCTPAIKTLLQCFSYLAPKRRNALARATWAARDHADCCPTG